MRKFIEEYAPVDSWARKLVDDLSRIKKDAHADYQLRMTEIGLHLGAIVAETLGSVAEIPADKDVCVICTVEDADFLGRGLISKLEQLGLGSRIRLLCLWNERINEGKLKDGSVALAPIIRRYEEKSSNPDPIFVVVNSIIAGACVAKTNLAQAYSFYGMPSEILVVAPVVLDGAEKRLCQSFPDELCNKMEFVHFAVDDETDDDGNVVPGIGGLVYPLLGLGDRQQKNRYVPKIVKDRRTKLAVLENLEDSHKKLMAELENAPISDLLARIRPTALDIGSHRFRVPRVNISHQWGNAVSINDIVSLKNVVSLNALQNKAPNQSAIDFLKEWRSNKPANFGNANAVVQLRAREDQHLDRCQGAPLNSLSPLVFFLRADSNLYSSASIAGSGNDDSVFLNAIKSYIQNFSVIDAAENESENIVAILERPPTNQNPFAGNPMKSVRQRHKRATQERK